MNHLLRGLAPFSDAAWGAIDDEARQRLTTQLAARKLVDFAGPHGWDHSATNLGRTTRLTNGPGDGVQATQRRVLPLVELHVSFELSRAELDDAERGAVDLDLAGLDDAARRIALAENRSVFHGFAAAGIIGIIEASAHSPQPLGGDPESTYPRSVAKAVDTLRQAGIGGPYGLAIGPTGHRTIIETTEHGGYLLLDHLRHILGGPVVWAPGVDGAVVLSLRGGDFLLEAGQDLSVGYLAHTAEAAHLYLEESISFRVTEPDAAVALTA